MENSKTEKVHISRITVGDTVRHDKKIRTVGKENIKTDSFLGKSIFGDCYRLGTLKVTRIVTTK